MSQPKRSFTKGLILVAVIGLGALGLVMARSTIVRHVQALRHFMHRTEIEHPNALWHVVHDLCVRDMQTTGVPAPCEVVDLNGGYAVIKDVEAKTQYLLAPTIRIPGIESPELLADGSPNYWRAAWAARRFIEKQVGHKLPREDIAFAVNSAPGRTQEQLHIHIDCVRPEVLRVLAEHDAKIGPHWTDFRPDLAGRRYRVRWMNDADLQTQDPFKLLAEDPAARADMGRETLVMIPTAHLDGALGFILLSDRADDTGADIAAGEKLLDHSCRILDAG